MAWPGGNGSSPDLGTDLDDLGRRLAERWGCDPARHRCRLAARRSRRRSPGCGRRAQRGLPTSSERAAGPNKPPGHSAASPSSRGLPGEPRLRILVAEVQARTASAFVATDATLHEERMTRQNARLRQLLATVAATEGPRRSVLAVDRRF